MDGSIGFFPRVSAKRICLSLHAGSAPPSAVGFLCRFLIPEPLEPKFVLCDSYVGCPTASGCYNVLLDSLSKIALSFFRPLVLAKELIFLLIRRLLEC